MNTTTNLRLVAIGSAALLALAGLAACGDDDDDTDTDTGTQDNAAIESPAPDGGEDMGGDDEMAQPMIDIAGSDLGEILTDGDGMTLYIFTEDQQGVSACYDDCATAWPPFLTEGDTTVATGLDESLLGVTERDDGTMQVTYNGQPLYYFAQDAAAGDVTGQGVNDVWYVLAPDGSAITDAGSGDPDY